MADIFSCLDSADVLLPSSVFLSLFTEKTDRNGNNIHLVRYNATFHNIKTTNEIDREVVVV